MMTDEEIQLQLSSFIKGFFKTAFCQGPDKTGKQKQDRKLRD